MTTWARRLAGSIALGTIGIGALSLSAAPASGQVPQPDAVIVGDSLTGGNATYIESSLRSNGLSGVRVEGLSGRKIAVSFQSRGYVDSGIARIRSLQERGIRPKLWVIQLGTNDLYSVKRCECSDPVAFAGALIDQLRREIDPATPTAWVTVMNRADYGVTNTFNEALRRRAAVDPYFRLIDWATLSMMQPGWFIDDVHQSMAGLRAFSEMYVRDISALLRDPPGPPAPRTGMQTAVRLGASLV
jgi:lysophospholipase L1-like esterase